MNAAARVPLEQITGVVLAGGRARRMGGVDKGLVDIGGRPMIEHVLDALAPQVGAIIINANRSHDSYARFGHPVIADLIGDYAGPLAGMVSGLDAAETPLVAFVPCDSPLVPHDLVARLYEALVRDDAQIAAAHDGERLHPVFALVRRDLGPDLHTFINADERKIDRWFSRHRFAHADFSDCPDVFANVNDDAERAALEARLSGTAD